MVCTESCCVYMAFHATNPQVVNSFEMVISTLFQAHAIKMGRKAKLNRFLISIKRVPLNSSIGPPFEEDMYSISIL